MKTLLFLRHTTQRNLSMSSHSLILKTMYWITPPNSVRKPELRSYSISTITFIQC